MSSVVSKIPLPKSESTDIPLRFVTAASLFDGHDAAINIMRRLIQAQGVEVIHLGHNRSVEDIVRAALQEDADGIAVSSYQGGHNEFFRYMVDRLKAQHADHIRVFGGGGGTITPDEIKTLEAYGVERIYHPDDGLRLGLVAMIEDLVTRTRSARLRRPATGHSGKMDDLDLARSISAIEAGCMAEQEITALRGHAASLKQCPVVGITGTGGAGKSSVTDELLNRLLHYFPDKRIAVLAIDPTRRRTGGALLGDRIRMNALRDPRVFMRSMATRRQHRATSEVLADCIMTTKAAGFDLILVETAGIGQSDSEIVDLVDLALYIMTSDYGAASQLEKIDMLDYADMIVLNKFDRRGSLDALRDVRKQWKRNHVAFTTADDEIPVFPTVASQFNDPGLTWMFQSLCQAMVEKLDLPDSDWRPELHVKEKMPVASALIPGQRVRYLAEIAEQGRAINARIEGEVKCASTLQHAHELLADLDAEWVPEIFADYSEDTLSDGDADATLLKLRQRYHQALRGLSSDSVRLLRDWPKVAQGVRSDQYQYTVRGRRIEGENYRDSLSHLRIPKIAAPSYADSGELLRFLHKENLPGHYPYTGGVYPYRRVGEDPTRMFAGEGTPERTNRRFHYVARDQSSARLSTAFDSVTLYGEDPDERPDIYGKVGNSGVSIATLDDMKKLYSGFDLCAPSTSVSMTINGPAPIILAFFMHTAIDQQVEKHLLESGTMEAAEKKIKALFKGRSRPVYEGELPPGHDRLGLRLLGVGGARVVDAQTYAHIKADTLARVRGTVQADILKEDQAQNTCIFSTEFALRMMGDIQHYFIDHKVRNFYSVSISGYHIAEAGANPITQLAFTLANGFTLVEYYRARGMAIDDFAPNLSFFFSNGMDPEYTVIGRVARRIWARAMRERYAAGPRSQMLKYHIQTSGRSLHAQEIQFNDIRTTLQALYAIFDNCNSLHTNAFDEAITTPTEASVRRALAIQLIINRELGLNMCENPWQGSFVVDELTDLVEAAVYDEFERISERGGVLGAMDTMYQRSKIQDESMLYEQRKHDGSLPIVGVNTFRPKDGEESPVKVELIRSTEAEKARQIQAVRHFKERHAGESSQAGKKLQQAARAGANLFTALMDAVTDCSLGEISHALYAVGGEYRRSM